MLSDGPPDEIFYCAMGGKSGPFYRTLRGVKSLMKTSYWARTARWSGDEQLRERRRVWKGAVVWTEITDEVAPSVEAMRERSR